MQLGSSVRPPSSVAVCRPLISSYHIVFPLLAPHRVYTAIPGHFHDQMTIINHRSVSDPSFEPLTIFFLLGRTYTLPSSRSRTTSILAFAPDTSLNSCLVFVHRCCLLERLFDRVGTVAVLKSLFEQLVSLAWMFLVSEVPVFEIPARPSHGRSCTSRNRPSGRVARVRDPTSR
jgi:hypothetical protein